MNKKLVLLLAIPFLAFACKNESASVDPAELETKVEAAAETKIKEAEAAAISECEARMTTEVNAKVDSIMASVKSTK